MPYSEKRFTQIETAVEQLSAPLNPSTVRLDRDEKLAVWAVSIAGIWLVGVTLAIGDMRSDLKIIKQSLKDHGQDVVSQIEQPTSNATLQVALNTVTADVRRATVEHKPKNQSKYYFVAEAVARATESHPDSNDVWLAAGALINYNSAATTSFRNLQLPYCFEGHMATYIPHPTGTFSRNMIIRVAKCTLVIDDLATFKKSEFWTRLHEEINAGVTDTFTIDLQEGNLIYRGGVPIPYSVLLCEGCTFSVETPVPPKENGKDLVRQLLAANTDNLVIQAKT